MLDLAFVIDDSPLERVISDMLLRKSFFAKKVVSFSAGADALAYITEHANEPEKLPEIIFLDIQMPVMTGFDFLDKYMEIVGQMARQPIIFIMSSSLNDEDFMEAKKYSVVKRFISKPMTPELIAELTSIL